MNEKPTWMQSRGLHYSLKPVVWAGTKAVCWEVTGMAVCHLCNARGPVVVDRQHGEYCATCCSLMMGIDVKLAPSAAALVQRERFAITHVGKDGLRVLTFANQGRNHYDTAEAAEEALKLFAPGLERVIGEAAVSTLRVLRVECYAHGDALGTVFGEEKGV